MHFVRTLHIKKYDPGKRRFQSDCFKPYGDGISVFEYECALNTTPTGICDHIAAFYPATVGDPPAYWLINCDHLVDYYKEQNIEVTWKQTISVTGDECHYDIYGIVKDKDKPYVVSFCKSPNLYICSSNGTKQIWPEADHELLASLYRKSISPASPDSPILGVN